MNTNNARIAVAKALRETLTAETSNHLVGSIFMRRLQEIDPELYDPSQISDQSLNAALNFCDDYFDGLAHKFDAIGDIPIESAREKLNQIISVLEKAEQITDPDILRFYHKPTKN